MIIFGSPGRYVQGPDALDALGDELSRLGRRRVVLVADKLVTRLHGERIDAACRAAGIEVVALEFGGECTIAEVEDLERRLVGSEGSGRFDLVVGVGGGKAIDAGKALSVRLATGFASVPTAASTDAPTSHNYVLYDENHTLLRVDRMRRNPDLVLVDTRVLASAPRHLLVAGIGDAVGKHLEAEACAASGGANIFGGLSARTAVFIARACRETIVEDAADALVAVEAGTPNPAFERLIEATILMSGLAFESGGLSIAHAMTRGLTALAPWNASPHGFQVAYANLVQMVVEERDPVEINHMVAFMRHVGLPTSLRDLGGSASDLEIQRIAELTMTAPHARNVIRPIDVEDLAEAMREVED